jgi:hypothetical protein
MNILISYKIGEEENMPNWEDSKQLLKELNKEYEEKELDSISTDVRSDIVIMMLQKEEFKNRPRGLRSNVIICDDYRELNKEDKKAIEEHNDLQSKLDYISSIAKNWEDLTDEERKEWLEN